jgi:hypothetical protein
MRCGKGASCLAAQDTELEVEVDAAECYYSSGSDTEHSQQQTSPLRSVVISYTGGDMNDVNSLSRTSSGAARSWTDGGFMAQEVDGIGGAVMMRKRRLVRIGAEIDEKDGGFEMASSPGSGAPRGTSAATTKYLEKEIKGERRSFCAWCQRIVPAIDDGWEA